jgi:hypothetical protein
MHEMRTNEIEDDEIARDGEIVRVPLLLMDAVQRSVAAAQRPNTFANAREAAYDAFKRDLADAWRGPGYKADDRELTADQARDEYLAWLQTAWQGAR